MSKKNELIPKETRIQAIKFLLFSISAGVIELLSYTLFFELLKLTAPLSQFFSVSLSVIWNFTLNRKFTFKSANNVKVAMIKVACFYILFVPLSTLWTKGLVNIGVNEYLVKALTMITNFVLEFLYCKFFVYKEKNKTISF